MDLDSFYLKVLNDLDMTIHLYDEKEKRLLAEGNSVGSMLVSQKVTGLRESVSIIRRAYNMSQANSNLC